MRTMTFMINDQSTESTNLQVWVTITENADGTLSFDVTQEGSIIGDLRGLFFDISDESLIGSLLVSGVPAPTQVLQGDDTIISLGGDANMNGLGGSDGGYDVGIELGTAGIGADDIRNYSFVLSSTTRDLTIEDFANVDFGARLTSVGVEDGARSDSAKILETTSPPIMAVNDVATVCENQSVTGNILDNDSAGLPTTDSISVTGWSGGALGTTIMLENAEGATLTLNSDGSYVLDALTADALSQGEQLEFSFTYDAKSLNEPTSWSTDQATLTVYVNGKNDAPIANDDNIGCIKENEIAQGNVLTNDSDIDRLDTIKVVAVNGIEDNGLFDLDDTVGTIKIAHESGGFIIMDENGHFTYDPSGAFDYLNVGEKTEIGFTYTISDNHGATDMADVTLCIEGIGTPPPPPPPSFDFPTMTKALSNIVLYLDDGDPLTAIYKVKFTPSESLGSIMDADDLNLGTWLNDNEGLIFGNTILVGFSIHAGNEYALTTYGSGKNKVFPLGPGEGQFYLYGDGSYLPGEADFKPTAANPWVTDDMANLGITSSVLKGVADYEVFLF